MAPKTLNHIIGVSVALLMEIPRTGAQIKMAKMDIRKSVLSFAWHPGHSKYIEVIPKKFFMENRYPQAGHFLEIILVFST